MGRAATLEVRSLPEWWAAPGGPGQVDDVHMGSGLPYSWMGLVIGGVSLRDGLLPAFAPWPGLEEVAAPRAWYDSTVVVVGEDAGWRGFSASLVELRAIAEPERTRRPQASFTMVRGSSALERTALFLRRGGEDSWLRGGAITGSRGGSGRLDRSGQHVWFADLGLRRGEQTFSGTFSQRGAASTTRHDAAFVDPFSGVRPPYAGLEDAARGESGVLAWGWERGERRLRATLARSHDRRESFESELFDLFAEREAQQNTIELEGSLGTTERRRGLRVELTQGQVERSADFLTQRGASDRRQRTVWLAASARRPLAGGRIELQLGAGHTDAPARSGERLQLAPSLVWRREVAGRRWRLHTGRIVTPVWADLAPGVEPFVQDTWAAGGDLAVGAVERQWFELGALATETGNRALLQRWPIRDISLRYGWTPDGVRVQDALLTLAAGIRRGAWGLDAATFTRVRPVGTQVARVDAAAGGRAGVETRFVAFTGDLGVGLRVEAAWVGERETEPLEGYFVQPRPLPGYATYGASASITLGDALIVLRAANLENVAHPQVWTDPTSPFPGVPALGSGRQFRVELSWPFFN